LRRWCSLLLQSVIRSVRFRTSPAWGPPLSLSSVPPCEGFLTQYLLIVVVVTPDMNANAAVNKICFASLSLPFVLTWRWHSCWGPFGFLRFPFFRPWEPTGIRECKGVRIQCTLRHGLHHTLPPPLPNSLTRIACSKGIKGFTQRITETAASGTGRCRRE